MTTLRDGGNLFWQEFEGGILSKLTDEHKQLFAAKEAEAYWIAEHERQRQVLTRVVNNINAFHGLTSCSRCNDFYIFDDEDKGENHTQCECGKMLCGRDDYRHMCLPTECVQCK